MLLKCRTQYASKFGKQQWPQVWKSQFSFQSQRKAVPKNVQITIQLYSFYMLAGFPGNSAGEESACNAGDPGLIPGSGRSHGEGIGYPLQYSWASLVVQSVENPSATGETWVWSLGWKIPWRRASQTTPVFLPGGVGWAIVHDVTKSQTWLSD